MTDQEQRVYAGTLVMVERYRAWMKEKKIEAQASPVGTGVAHAYYLLNIMRYELLNGNNPDFDLWKASRWLGFIQAEIIRAGWTTVQEERDFSRPLLKKSAAPWRPPSTKVEKQSQIQ